MEVAVFDSRWRKFQLNLLLIIITMPGVFYEHTHSICRHFEHQLVQKAIPDYFAAFYALMIIFSLSALIYFVVSIVFHISTTKIIFLGIVAVYMVRFSKVEDKDAFVIQLICLFLCLFFADRNVKHVMCCIRKRRTPIVASGELEEL